MNHTRKVVFITGASSGIGYAAALEFAKRGYHVAGTARRAHRLDALQTEIEQLPGTDHGDFLPLTVDVRDEAVLKDAVRQTVQHFGHLDVLVANAGVGQRGSLVEARWEDIDSLLRTNIDGVLHSIRAAVPVMAEGGHIVIVSSVVYNMTAPYTAVYAASKAFVSSIARSLRLELEPKKIGVTDMLVGRTETEFNEKRLGQPGRTGGGLPVMPVEKVAVGIVDAVEKRRKTVALRWFDRLIVLANLLIPTLIGRRAVRQYK